MERGGPKGSERASPLSPDAEQRRRGSDGGGESGVGKGTLWPLREILAHRGQAPMGINKSQTQSRPNHAGSLHGCVTVASRTYCQVGLVLSRSVTAVSARGVDGTCRCRIFTINELLTIELLTACRHQKPFRLPGGIPIVRTKQAASGSRCGILIAGVPLFSSLGRPAPAQSADPVAALSDR